MYRSEPVCIYIMLRQFIRETFKWIDFLFIYFFTMAQQNGFIVPSVCPFSGLSAKINGDVDSQKSEKPALRIKMPQPIELVNHDIEGYENYDTLHSQIDEVSSSFVSYFVFLF